MVVACAAAISLIGPGRLHRGWARMCPTGSPTLDAAFVGLAASAQSECVWGVGNDSRVKAASFGHTDGSTIEDQSANELWTVLVCKPWWR